MAVTVARGCLIAVAMLLGVLFLIFGVMQLSLNREAEAKAWEQLTDRYGTTQITKNDRVYFGPRATYYAYAQICYDITIASPSGANLRKAAMVVGDDDGGTFRFAGEFPSIEACEAKFNHG